MPPCGGDGIPCFSGVLVPSPKRAQRTAVINGIFFIRNGNAAMVILSNPGCHFAGASLDYGSFRRYAEI